jgi:hypothetical protein
MSSSLSQLASIIDPSLIDSATIPTAGMEDASTVIQPPSSWTIPSSATEGTMSPTATINGNGNIKGTHDTDGDFEMENHDVRPTGKQSKSGVNDEVMNQAREDWITQIERRKGMWTVVTSTT